MYLGQSSIFHIGLLNCKCRFCDCWNFKHGNELCLIATIKIYNIETSFQCFYAICLLDCSDNEDEAAIKVLDALLKVFPPTAGGGKSKNKRKKISPQQAFPLLFREEQVRLHKFASLINLLFPWMLNSQDQSRSLPAVWWTASVYVCHSVILEDDSSVSVEIGLGLETSQD